MTAAHHRFPAVTFAAIQTELARELAQRRATYRDWIGKGRMTQEEADWQLSVIAAIAEDAARFEAAMAPIAQGRPMQNPLDVLRNHKFTWQERRQALLRELDYRQRLYPEWIRKGRLTHPDAAKQCDALRAMLALYEDGLDWQASNGARPPSSDRQARIEWNRTWLDIVQRRGAEPAVIDGAIQLIAQDDEQLAAELHAARQPQEQKELAV